MMKYWEKKEIYINFEYFGKATEGRCHQRRQKSIKEKKEIKRCTPQTRQRCIFWFIITHFFFFFPSFASFLLLSFFCLFFSSQPRFSPLPLYSIYTVSLRSSTPANGGCWSHLPASLPRSHRTHRQLLCRSLRRWQSLPLARMRRRAPRAAARNPGPLPQRHADGGRALWVDEDGAVSSGGAAAARAVRALPRRRVRGDESGAGRVEGQGESHAQVEV